MDNGRRVGESVRESGDWAAWKGRVGNNKLDRSAAPILIFDDIYRNRGALRQQLAALETTVEDKVRQRID
jgi:hypothetical protein